MDDQLARAIGGRLRSSRIVKRKSQVAIAGLAGITTDYLYQIERGKKLPTLPVLIRLASVLNVPLPALLDEPDGRRNHQASQLDVGRELQRALTQPVARYEPPSVPALHDHVRSAWRVWQTSPYRYSKLSSQLPVLISDLVLAERRHTAEGARAERRQVQSCAADLYGLLRTFTKRIGRTDLSLLVADRAIHAAEAADDPLRLAAARWNLAHVLLAGPDADNAESVAIHAAEALTRVVGADGELAADAAAMSGALTLLGAVAAARRGQVWTARERVREVAPIAERTGERNVFWTTFGPTNVAMYAVSVEIEAGDANEALSLAERVAHDRSPSIERRVAFLLDTAKGHTQRRDFDSALTLLRTASREAPEDVAHRPNARSLLTSIVRHGQRGVAAEAAELAQHVGLIIE